MSNLWQTGFREDLIYNATPPRRRVWTRSAQNTVKLVREISVSSTDGVNHVSVKAMIVGALEDISKLSSAWRSEKSVALTNRPPTYSEIKDNEQCIIEMH